jgi:hypothetical protein
MTLMSKQQLATVIARPLIDTSDVELPITITSSDDDEVDPAHYVLSGTGTSTLFSVSSVAAGIFGDRARATPTSPVTPLASSPSGDSALVIGGATLFSASPPSVCRGTPSSTTAAAATLGIVGSSGGSAVGTETDGGEGSGLSGPFAGGIFASLNPLSSASSSRGVGVTGVAVDDIRLASLALTRPFMSLCLPIPLVAVGGVGPDGCGSGIGVGRALSVTGDFNTRWFGTGLELALLEVIVDCGATGPFRLTLFSAMTVSSILLGAPTFLSPESF